MSEKIEAVLKDLIECAERAQYWISLADQCALSDLELYKMENALNELQDITSSFDTSCAIMEARKGCTRQLKERERNNESSFG